MKLSYVVWIAVACLALSAITADCATLSKDQETQWIRYTIPLPKNISISESVTVNKGSVAIAGPGQSDMIMEQALKDMTALFGPSASGNASFTVTLAVGGPDAEQLKSLKNSDQAYRIVPDGNKGLKLIALTTRGLNYAMLTLRQLVSAKAASGKLEMPIVTVLDWPDIHDRGLWGSDSFEHIPWQAAIKFNYNEEIASRGIRDDGTGFSEPKGGQEPYITEGPKYGIQPVPVSLHLDQVMGEQMLKVYPKFKGIGGDVGAICYSQPEFVKVLSDWIADLGSLPNVTEVDCWMSENLHAKGGCKCPECSKTERSLLEERTIVAAWRKAQQKLPNLGLRVLASEETYRMNGPILEELPKEVKFWYYQSQLTYNTSQHEMIYPLLASYAKKRWVGVCPSLTQYIEPFTCPQFARYRMNEFVDKNMQGVIGYTFPRVEQGFFNAEGAAEWSWNAKGRSSEEYALSYAARHGIKNAQKFAQWAVTNGKVAWDVYGSDWPDGNKKKNPGSIAKLVLERRLPGFGETTKTMYGVPFEDIKSEAQLNSGVELAVKAIALAKEVGMPEYIYESTIIQGYINSLKGLHELNELVTKEGVATVDKPKARKYFLMYLNGLQQAIDTLPKWEAVVSEFGTAGGTGEVINTMTRMQNEMRDAAKKLDVKL